MTRASDTARLLGAGATILDGTTISTADNDPQLILKCTDTDASTGPKLDLERNPGEAGADGDNLAQINFYGYNDASEKTQYLYLFAEAADVANGSEDVRFGFGGLVAGADSSIMTFTHGTSATGADPEIVFNDSSKDINFRVEGNNSANLLFIDGGNDHICMNTSTDAGGVLNIKTTDNTANLVLFCTDTDSNGGPILDLFRNSSSPADGDVLGLIRFKGEDAGSNETTYAQIIGFIQDEAGGAEDGTLKIETLIAGSSEARLDFTLSETVFNEGSKDIDFRVESDGNANMLFVDGGNNVVCFDTTDVNPAENNVAGVGILTGGKISASADGNFGLQVNRKSSFGGVIHLRKDGAGKGFLAIFEDSSSGRLLLGNDNTCLLFNDSTKQIIPFNSVGAKQDDVIALGNASGRFDQVFSANGSLNTSDRNEKQDIEELTDAEKRVAVKAKSLVRKYRWKKRVTEKGDNARTHVGVIAQDLQDAFTAEGLDATKYGMFCSDTWWDNDEVFVDDDGKEHDIVKSYYTEEEAPEGSTKKTRLAVRYSELLAFIISAI